MRRSHLTDKYSKICKRIFAPIFAPKIITRRSKETINKSPRVVVHTPRKNPHTGTTSAHTLTIGSYIPKAKICVPDFVKAERL